jgi:hypothetical protein
MWVLVVSKTAPDEPWQGERRGWAVVYGRGEHLLGPFVENLGSILIRETGF